MAAAFGFYDEFSISAFAGREICTSDSLREGILVMQHDFSHPIGFQLSSKGRFSLQYLLFSDYVCVMLP